MWINVIDKLPEHNQYCLCVIKDYREHRRVKMLRYVRDLYELDKYDFCENEGQYGFVSYDREYGFMNHNVSHWQPIPKPPKDN